MHAIHLERVLCYSQVFSESGVFACQGGGGRGCFLLFITVVGLLLKVGRRFTCNFVLYIISDTDDNQHFAPFDTMAKRRFGAQKTESHLSQVLQQRTVKCMEI